MPVRVNWTVRRRWLLFLCCPGRISAGKWSRFPVKKKNWPAAPVFVPLPTNKITYLNWYFDVTGMEPQLLPYCNLLITRCAGASGHGSRISTRLSKYTRQMYTGGITFNFMGASAEQIATVISWSLRVHAKRYRPGTETVPALEAIALKTSTDKGPLQELVGTLLTDWDNNFFSRGQEVAKTRLGSLF